MAAKRRATRKYTEINDFIEDYDNGLNKGSLQLPSGSYRGELANEIKLDISIPEIGRFGPIVAQVVLRSPDGTVALRIPTVPDEIHEAYKEASNRMLGDVQPFIEMGLVILKSEHDQIVSELEEKIANQLVVFEEQLKNALDEKEAESKEKIAAMAARLAASGGTSGPVSTVITRGFPIPHYEDTEPSFKGVFGNEDFVQFIVDASANKVTGLLVVEDGDQKRYGFFDKGGPVGWRSEPLLENEVLGMLLYKAKQITKEQLQTSLEMMEEKSIRQGEAFSQMGVMSFSQMVRVLGKQVDFIFHQVRTMKSGQFTFYPLEELPERFVPPRLNTIEILFREKYKYARKASQDQIYKDYAIRLNSYMSYSEVAKRVIGQIKFNAQEKRLVEVIGSKNWRLREAFSVSPLSKGAMSAFIWSCNELGFFDYADSEDESRTEERYSGRFLRKKRQIQGGSYFDILEVHWICLPQEVEDAYKKMRDFFDVSLNTEMPSQFHNDAKLISKSIHEAYTKLKVDSQRREYRLEMIEKEMIKQSAALLSKKGEMAIMRRDRREACGCYSKALELVPGNQEYRDGLRRAAAVTSGPAA